VFATDEARLGLISWHKRRYCPLGVRPPWVVRRRYEWTWLYAAVEPTTGEDCCLYLPSLDGVCYELFLQHLSRCYSDDLILLVQDNAPAHRSEEVDLPHNIVLLSLPPYSPELNPVERWFLEFRRQLANRLFGSIEALQEAATEVLRHYWNDREALKRLTNFPWWQKAVEQL
jgi:transposase